MSAPARLLVAGYYGHGNAGDEAILAAMLEDLRALRPDLEIVVASGDPARTAAEHGVRAVAAGRPAELAAAVGESDLVLLGGGGLFQDYWEVPTESLLTTRQGGLLSYLAPPVLAALLGKPAMVYAVGVGPLQTAEGRRLTRVAFELCARATVRDEPSLALVRELGIAGVELAADPAFGLAPLPAAERPELLAGLGLDAGEPLVAVALRHWDFGVDPRSWEAAVARGLDRHLAELPGRLVFLPFQREASGPYEDDRAVSRRVAALLSRGGRAVVVERRLSPRELAAVLASCRQALAMRYHAALFALAAGVPVASLAYDPKVSSLLADAGLAGLALPPAEWTADGVADVLRRAVAESDPERLAAFAAGLRSRASASARRAVELLAAGPAAPRSAARRFLDELAVEKALAAARLEREGLALRRLLADRDEDLAAAGRRLEAREDALSAVRRELAAREAEQSRLQQGGLDAVWQAQRLAREQREVLLQERNEIARRLAAIEATLVYRLGTRIWALMRRLFPEGSPRRGLYRRIRGLLGRLLGAPAPPPPLLLSPEEPAVEAPDPRGDLLRFEERMRGAGTVAVFFSATQLVESEGQRPTQLALELARRGVPVVFCYWRWWPTEWRPQDRLDDGIVQIPIDVVVERPEMIAGAFARVPERLALFELPYPGFFEPLAALNAEGWISVYDVLDDWDEFHRVGQAVWYEEDFERHLAGAADAVFAINDFLAGRIRKLGGAGVEVIGNGLKPGLEAVREPLPLERGEVTVGYFGYLAGAWFDWELIAGAARRRPAWRFYLIGYGGSPEGVRLPANVALLGKKPQSELAAWAANWDVAVIPFKPDRLAAGSDPIKTYEYLAMGLPVVATGVYPPAGGEAFVARAEGIEAFIAELARAAAGRGDGEAAARRAFAAGCTWEARLDALLGTVARGGQRVAEKRALAGLEEGRP
ncbi:MAG TPA: polysaccharide pyruvyl transferase CsaB [Thermoanaerobaculia bacterium]|nr:polysaccharide pyruvyl transferase CsaB [Thermoanaerobaculia bacterium]